MKYPQIQDIYPSNQKQSNEETSNADSFQKPESSFLQTWHSIKDSAKGGFNGKKLRAKAEDEHHTEEKDGPQLTPRSGGKGLRQCHKSQLLSAQLEVPNWSSGCLCEKANEGEDSRPSSQCCECVNSRDGKELMVKVTLHPVVTSNGGQCTKRETVTEENLRGSVEPG